MMMLLGRACKGGSAVDPASADRQVRTQRQDHAVGTGVRGLGALSEIHSDLEPLVIVGVSQYEDGLPALLSRLLQPFLD